MNNERKDLSYGMWAFNYIYAVARSAGMEHDKRIIHALKYITLKSRNQQAVKTMLNRTVGLIQKSPGYIAAQLSNNPFTACPPPGIIDGEIKIGYVYDNIRKRSYSFGISRYELNQHMLESGRSGGGKTTVLILILSNLIHLNIPFCIFDFKRDYRSMIRHSKNFYVFNKNNFRFNPLIPPKKTEPVQWASIFTDIFFQNFYQGTASSAKSIFLDTLLKLYKQKNQITFNDVCNEFNRMLYDKNCSNNIKESIRTIMVRLKPFNSILGDAINSPSFDMEDLLTKQVVLELDGLTIEYQTFLATLIFHWIFTYRLNLAQRASLQHLLLFDEAKRLFSLGIPLVGQLVSLAREFGQGLILADQMPSCLDHATLANVYTTITLNLSAPRDINAISYAMGLNTEQKQALNSLPLKTAIVKMAGRYTRPFQIHIPDLIIDKNINDSELAIYMKPKLEALIPVNPKQSNAQSNPEQEKEKPAQESDEISENERNLLWDIKSHPYIPATERQQSLNFTTYMAGKLYSGLIAKELIVGHEVKVNYRGRPQKFYELTGKGTELAGQQNLGSGKGGFIHRLHQHRLKKVFESQGYKVKIEEFKNGKNADLGLTKGNKSIAVEIAMSAQGEVSNIEKDLAAGWNEVWTLCNTESILKSIEKEWAQKDSSVKLQLLSNKQFF
jgi:Helicase HerA, central domain